MQMLPLFSSRRISPLLHNPQLNEVTESQQEENKSKQRRAGEVIDSLGCKEEKGEKMMAGVRVDTHHLDAGG